MAGKLKLRAVDDEDLAVLSAILQDALLAVGDMALLPEEGRFVLVANRFRWERPAAERGERFERTLVGIAFDRVTGVRRRGFSPAQHDRMLHLLALRAMPGAILIELSGGAGIRLEVDGILCHLEDLGEPWPTSWRPRHPVEPA